SDIMISAAGQGALGLEIRSGDDALLDLLQPLHDETAFAEVTAERALLRGLGGGCQVPIGARARVEGDMLHLDGCVCSPDGRNIIKTQMTAHVSEAAALGERAAVELLDKGAAAMLE